MSGGGDADADLVRRALAGDRRAFADLARRHGPRLARTARTLGVAPAEVEDVTQAALLSAWRALADFDRSRSFAAWITAILVNKARDWRRQRLIRRWWIEGQDLDRPEALAAADPAAGPDAAEARLKLRQLEEALKALPERLRLPLVLTAVAGLTQKEAAAALGVGLRTLETRVAEARAALEQTFGR